MNRCSNLQGSYPFAFHLCNIDMNARVGTEKGNGYPWISAQLLLLSFLKTIILENARFLLVLSSLQKSFLDKCSNLQGSYISFHSIFELMCYIKDLNRASLQSRPQTFVTAWKYVNFLSNRDKLHLFPIPELPPCWVFFCHPCWTFPPCFFSLKSWHSVLWIEKSRCAFRVNLIRWSNESRLIPLRIPTVMRSLLDPAAKKDSASSQIGNHRHQHCAAAAAASFGREKSDKFTVEKNQINSQRRRIG